MRTLRFLAIFTVALALSGQLSTAIPTATNCDTVVYTNITDPIKIAFAPDGTLFVGRDNSGSGGSPSDPVKIHKVGTNASSVVEFGNVALADPDAVGYDAVGLVSGTAGSVLVGGSAGSSSATISKITPAGIVSTLFGGVITNASNPGEFLLDAAGRAFISDSGTHRVLTTASSVAPTVLCVSTGAYALAFDASNRLAVGSFSLPRIQLFSTNGTLLVTNFATINAGAPVVQGRGDAFWGKDLYSVNGSSLVRIDPLGTNTVVGSGFSGFLQMAFGPDNALYVSARDSDLIYKISPTPRGPTHWWPLDGNLIDVIGGENGFASNGTFYVSGQVGQCFDFYGTNYINFGTNAGVVGTEDFSVTMWVKMFSSLTTGAKMLSGETNGCPGATYWRAHLTAQNTLNSKPTFSISGGASTALSAVSTTSVATNNVEDGTWHHVAFVRQGATCAVYRDGVLQATDSAAAIANITGNNRLIAGQDLCNAGSGAQYRGQMDEIKMFGVALTPAEVVADMTRPTLNIAPLSGAMRLTWTTNAPGYQLETNSSMLTTNWGVLTTNYSIIETNYAVTNTVGGTTRFYRLHKP